MIDAAPWTPTRILRELCTAERRERIVRALWRRAPPETRRAAADLVAEVLRFRGKTLRSAPLEKKVRWTLARLGEPRLEQVFVEALLAYHFEEAVELMSSCLDAWKMPHEKGVVAEGHQDPPSREAVAASIDALAATYPLADLLLYLAAAGWVMGEELPGWREATWPEVDARHAAADAADSRDTVPHG